MSLKINTQYLSDKDIWVVMVAGEIDIYTANCLKETLINLINERNTDIQINCEELDYIDSTGLGVLIGALKRLKQDNKNIIITKPKQNISKLLNITGLNKIFIIEG
ncbi:STAS domain-containing protein [Geosporobacter ferrireducens]|uniref:Anti-sigma factor antagonist n=1 Tax=Geosporobacter ferrireducens TaxID=1424294 RepID=A0A1D8GHQ9_9FIRM|nr:STAS domain-containing protein [Geosporobacter ferrireducens]AOT70453.1 anti-anti-sigma factor [Geosporobacter ferrireducens]MTI57201.1 STAS domain-containing protein [Geosporobacter ferrireducens]